MDNIVQNLEQKFTIDVETEMSMASSPLSGTETPDSDSFPNSEGYTDHEIFSFHESDDSQNIVSPLLSDSNDFSEESFEISDMIADEEHGFEFLYDKNRSYRERTKQKYFSELAKQELSLLFKPFFSGDFESNSNLISYLDLEGHKLLIQALDISNKKSSTYIKDNVEQIKSIIRGLFQSIQIYNMNVDINKNELWDVLIVVVVEAANLNFFSLIEEFIDIIPNPSTKFCNMIEYENKFTQEPYPKIPLLRSQIIKHLPQIVSALKLKPFILTDLVKTHYNLIRFHEGNFVWPKLDTTFTMIYHMIGLKKSLSNGPINRKQNTQLKFMSIFSQYYIKISHECLFKHIEDQSNQFAPQQIPEPYTPLIQDNNVILNDRCNSNQLNSSPTQSLKRKNTFETPEQPIISRIPQVTPLKDRPFEVSEYSSDELISEKKHSDDLSLPAKRIKLGELSLMNTMLVPSTQKTNVVEYTTFDAGLGL